MVYQYEQRFHDELYIPAFISAQLQLHTYKTVVLAHLMPF